jgi:uncharacterized ferritin-like protein (DUF455 family)
MSLRHEALRVLLLTDADAKADAALRLDPDGDLDPGERLAEPPGIPGRPERPVLVAPAALAPRPVHSVEGRAALIHALAHIEINAVDLACDLVWRFAGLPDDFYRQWLTVAQDEARHFCLLREHLGSLGHAYGDFPAHDALWTMADRTRDDLLARLALVPRTLEARGLDAAPPIRAKLVGAGDSRGGEILDRILQDEIRHVAIGNHWFRWLCTQRGVDAVRIYDELATRYDAPVPRGPFNLPARRAAGFVEAEIAALQASTGNRPRR